MKDKRYTKITRKRLLECLKTIWYSFYYSWCNMFYIKNQYWNITNWIFHSKSENDEIREIKLDAKFWEWNENSNGWACVFILKWCYLTVQKDSVNIMVNKADKCKQPAFISFYNFNK